MTEQTPPIFEMDSTNLKRKRTIGEDEEMSLFRRVRIKTSVISYIEEPEDLDISEQGLTDQERLGLASPTTVALPKIYVHDPNPTDRFRTSSTSSSYNSIFSTSTSSIPMSIPHSRDPVPPPLPPPRYLADIADGGNTGPDITWQWGNSHSHESD